jgi:hypothetical protein
VDVEVPLPVSPRADLRVVEAVLVPSLAIQPVLVASIGFEPRGPWLTATVKELWSRAPGEAMALSGFSMHSIPPPVMDGRSVWVILVPVVLCAGILLRTGENGSGGRRLVRRSARAAVGAVWGLGFALLCYHQTVALAVDLERFGGSSREEAYELIDGTLLWEDIKSVAPLVPVGASVDFVTSPDLDPVVSALWTGRAAYYLIPVSVRPSGEVRLQYYGGPHPPCASTDSRRRVLRESERFCLFGPPS